APPRGTGLRIYNYLCEIHRPVGLPGFASVNRERLLPMRFVGEIRPQEADANRFPLQGIAGVKRSDTIFESAGYRRIEMAGVTPIDPPNGPLFFRPIKSAERPPTISAGRKIEEILIHVPSPAENLLHDAPTFELDPVVITSKSFLQTPVMNTPVSNQEIEIVGAFHVILPFSILILLVSRTDIFSVIASGGSYLIGGCIFAKGEISRPAPTSPKSSSSAVCESPVFWLSEADTR